MLLFSTARATRNIFQCKITDKTQNIDCKLCALKLSEMVADNYQIYGSLLESDRLHCCLCLLVLE